MRIILPIILSLAGCARETAERPADEPSREPTAQSEGTPAASSVPPAAPQPAREDVGACRKQGDAELPPNALRAVGTEPFWGARIEGRCVTYSTPDDIDGTRIWTRFVGSRDSGVWTGQWNGEDFVLRTRRATCSDGMSDRAYPVAVSLTIGGEERTGCADWRDWSEGEEQ